ncbi:sugar transferase [Paucilactobacillus wasatchensis]|uniref:Capsular polysaccharide biosynthesis protein n=1 Tax=Paucilactobacillus wasatchensis TaxID=1335616 RepID=A0A0D0Y7V5_9LACO|nr:sugar transferase [Paucilactobacillus wasatchensis]KIS04343.1 Capsular polysaccharide biosynthesis protein [Paucilactobacillus wasatchensis]
MYQSFVKRFFDIVVSTVALIVLAIPFLVIAAIIRLDSHGPVFFRQQRTGLNGDVFRIYKFRTMKEKAPHEMATSELCNAEDQITHVGAFLRKTSIDELPQLINVFVGQMSIIGPRPVILSETELIEMRHKNGADRVLPGLTGLAQVHGRDEVSNFKKASYDGVYALKVSARTDTKITLRTVWYVLLHIGIREGKKESNGYIENSGTELKTANKMHEIVKTSISSKG